MDQSFVQRGWFLHQFENLILHFSKNFVCENEIKPIFESFENPEYINCVLNIKFLQILKFAYLSNHDVFLWYSYEMNSNWMMKFQW